MAEEDDHKDLPEASIYSFATAEDDGDFFLVVEPPTGGKLKIKFPGEHATFLVRVIQDHMRERSKITEYPREVASFVIGPEANSKAILLTLTTVDDKSFSFSFDQSSGAFDEIVAVISKMHAGMPPSGSSH